MAIFHLILYQTIGKLFKINFKVINIQETGLLNILFAKQADGSYKNPTFDNNQLLWANVKEYANREPNKLHYNDFLNHNRDVYWNSIFWTKYPGVNK